MGPVSLAILTFIGYKFKQTDKLNLYISIWFGILCVLPVVERILDSKIYHYHPLKIIIMHEKQKYRKFIPSLGKSSQVTLSFKSLHRMQSWNSTGFRQFLSFYRVFHKTWSSLKTGCSNKHDSLRTGCSNKHDSVRTGCSTKHDSLRTGCSTVHDSLRTWCSTKHDSSKTGCSNKHDSLRTRCSNKHDSLRTGCSTKHDSLKTGCST